jgi:uncharacterized protein YlxP (DUF503 family)
LSFVCLLEIQLHFPDNASLKGKRKELQSLKSQLQRRFGAAVAETDHHEVWQRATVSAAVVGRSHSGVSESANRIQRFVESRFPETSSTERVLMSSDDLL